MVRRLFLTVVVVAALPFVALSLVPGALLDSLTATVVAGAAFLRKVWRPPAPPRRNRRVGPPVELSDVRSLRSRTH